MNCQDFLIITRLDIGCFGGNLVKQPAFTEILKINNNAYRVVGIHKGADQIMNNQLFLGTYPGLTKEMLDHEIYVINEFFNHV